MTSLARKLLLSTALAGLLGLSWQISSLSAEEQWPGGCEPIQFCGMGNPPGSCGSECVVHGSGDFCVTGGANMCN